MRALDLTRGQRPFTCVVFLPQTQGPQSNRERYRKETLIERGYKRPDRLASKLGRLKKQGESEKVAQTRQRRQPNVTWEERGTEKG